ncbi:DegT/DnrJ/EryC1/StrS family aminotransferase, partial [bacterium]|nr:DegT/DnrJ/EryC1/StrS family aminotransferase [bacterium]
MIALQVLDLPPGADVIVPSNTYIATILAIMREGFTPVLVEPDPKTCNIDPARIEPAITSKTKAIMVVHLYGKSCEMDVIADIAARHRLPVIEDCAQSHGAKFKGRMTGTWGLGAFSFYPTKNLGAMGDAGALVTPNAVLDEKARMIRNYGSKVKYYNEVVGMNSRLDEMQAALLRIKLRRLDEINNHKRKLAAVYFSELAGVSDLILPAVSEHTHDVYHIYNVRTPARDRLREHLKIAGIGTEIHYPVSPHLQNALKDRFAGMSFPISEEIHRTTLSLPISFFHTEEQVRRVCGVIRGFYGK